MFEERGSSMVLHTRLLYLSILLLRSQLSSSRISPGPGANRSTSSSTSRMGWAMEDAWGFIKRASGAGLICPGRIVCSAGVVSGHGVCSADFSLPRWL